MAKTYMVRTKIYYKITVSDNAEKSYGTPEAAAISASEAIHGYELYWLNDEGATHELKLAGCDVDKVRFVRIHHEICKALEEE